MKDWTIMIYMAGNNNLSDDMVAGLKGIENCAKIDDGRIAVTAYYDTAAIGIPPVVCDFTGPRFEERAGRSVSVDSIREFIEWSVRDRGHVARNYAIIFSGHGDGYQKGNFLCDMNARKSVRIAELAAMLQKITSNRPGQGFRLGQRFGMIGFDSCVMNTLEVLYELKGVTDFVVGSQGFVPNAGWDYGTFFRRVTEVTGKIEPQVLARNVCEAFIDANRPFAFRSGRSVDISTIDLRPQKGKLSSAGFDRIAVGIDRLGRKLADIVANPKTCRLAESAILASHWKCQTTIFDQAVDIADFCAAVAAELGARSAENQLLIENLSDSAVAATLRLENKSIARINNLCKSIVNEVENVAEFHSLGPEMQWGSGISLFFPWSYRSFELSRENYLDYAFAVTNDGTAASGWLTFLEVYLQLTMRPIRAGEASGKKQRLHYDDRESGAIEISKRPRSLFTIGHLAAAAGDGKFTPPYVKFTPPYVKFLGEDGSRFTPPYVKFTPPYVKLQASNGGTDSTGLANFGRFKNFPWFPVDWDPTDSALDE